MYPLQALCIYTRINQHMLLASMHLCVDVHLSNTVGGGLVLPRADLGELEGLQQGAVQPVAMVDGKPFNGAKAYKDSKVRRRVGFAALYTFDIKQERRGALPGVFALCMRACVCKCKCECVSRSCCRCV